MDGLERSVETSNQLRQELLNAVQRYCKEGDLTYFQILGVLEMVKDDVKAGRQHSVKKKDK